MSDVITFCTSPLIKAVAHISSDADMEGCPTLLLSALMALMRDIVLNSSLILLQRFEVICLSDVTVILCMAHTHPLVWLGIKIKCKWIIFTRFWCNTMNWVKALNIYLILPSIPSTKQGSAEYNIKITDIGAMNAIKVIKTMQMHAVLDLTLYTRELLNSIFHSPFVEFIGVRFTLCDKTFFYLTQYLFNASSS